MLFVGTMCDWRLLETIEFVYRAKNRKIHYKVISVLGRFRQVQAIKGDCRWRRQRIMRCAQPICARNCKPARLRVHACCEGQQLLKLGARCQIGDIAERVEHSQGGACILYDLIGEETWESDVVCAPCRIRLAHAWEPLEQKDEGADGLEGLQRGWVEGIEVIDDERYAERLEKLAAAGQSQSSTIADE